MTFGEICNYFLYALSGFFFGIFASRYSILAAIKIVANVKEQGVFSGVLGSLLQVVFIAVAFFITIKIRLLSVNVVSNGIWFYFPARVIEKIKFKFRKN